MVEIIAIKAIINLKEVHLAQAKNYLEAYNMEAGLLINFGAKVCNLKESSIKKQSRNP